MIAYLSGKMTGLPDYNFPEFNRIACKLRHMGFDVLNPAEAFDGRTDLPRSVYMRNDVASVLKAQVLIQMPGWRESSGATLEYNVAKEIGLAMWELPNDF